MNKIVKIALALIVVFIAFSIYRCSTIDDRIETACKKLDFEKAHQLLESRMNFFTIEYDDEKRLVFEKETDYLLDQNDETASKRIIILLSEIMGEDKLDKTIDGKTAWYRNMRSLCSSLITKAKKTKNTYLIKELAQADDFFFLDCIDYLCEEKTEDDLLYAKDMVIKRSKDICFVLFDISNYNDREDKNCSTDYQFHSRTKYGFREVFNTSIRTGNMNVTKELLEHLSYLQQTTSQSLEEKDKETVNSFIKDYNLTYQNALKKK